MMIKKKRFIIDLFSIITKGYTTRKKHLLMLLNINDLYQQPTGLDDEDQ